jgi:hypothetical protein
LKHIGVDGSVILKWILIRYNGVGEGGDWIDLGEDGGRWRPAVKAVVSLPVV